MQETGSISRRGFLKGLAASAAIVTVPTFVPSTSLGIDGAAAPSNRITLGFIGTGSHGVGMNLRSFLRLGDAQAVALCDVEAGRVAGALNVVKRAYGAKFKGCYTTGDWRNIIARDDIDAVMISTPDHWHVPMSLAAVRAGKDVCCEKPTLTIRGGRILADAVKRYGTVFQTTTEDRSIAVYHRMAELVRNGRIGKLHTIRVKLPAGPGQPGNPAPMAVPHGFDYNMWLGPAPWAPYTKDRCHYHFRWIRDYSGGQLTDWGAHLIDTVQWANDTERTGPIEVAGQGVYHKDGLYDTAHQYHLEYKYANGVTMFVDSGAVDLKFEGTDGWVANYGWRGSMRASSKAIHDSIIAPEEIHLFKGNGEHRNFLDCVKTRRDPYFPAEIGHRCASVTHVGNIAMQLGRKLRWDPDAERFIDDEQADQLRSRATRDQWHL